MSFQGKVVWVTGASSGIGEALARAFHQKGANLILSARREGELARVRDELDAKESGALILPLDLERPESLQQKAGTALDQFGKIDILVNNGGISQRALTRETQLDVDRRIMNINYFGAIALTKAVLPSMLSNKSGHIVAISSLAGKFGTPLRSAYSASKHALHGFFESLRSEVWQEGINVTLVCPGYISTNISVNALTGEGELFNRMDQAVAQGMPPARCAQQILSAIERGKDEVFVGRARERMLIYFKFLAPRRFTRMIRKAAPK